MKREDIRSENGKAYFRFWSNALKGLLGWPDSRIEQWADKFGDTLHDESDLLYHGLPGTYVIADYLNERCPDWRNQLPKEGVANFMREISDCINEFIYPELENNQGWDEARKRLDETLKQSGLIDKVTT